MSFQKFFQSIFGTLFLILFVLAASGLAQKPTPTPTLNVLRDNREVSVVAGSNLYCAGYVETNAVDTTNKIVGAENEQEKFTYAQGDNVYINLGANRGVKVGDRFAVIRPRGQVETRWTRKGNLGFFVQEVGSLEVIKVKNEVSVARISYSCDNFLLGDLLQPFAARTSPTFAQRPALDVFGEPSGKTSGRIFMARDNQELLGREQIVYIDLGAEDNVKVGDYLTIYRPLGKGNLFDKPRNESLSARESGFQSERYRGGKFSNQAPRKSGERARGSIVTTEDAKENRPAGLRKVVGELVILNVKERTATAVITRTVQEIHTGDSVEVQ